MLKPINNTENTATCLSEKELGQPRAFSSSMPPARDPYKPYILLVTTQYQKKRQFPFHFRLLRKELFEIHA